MTGTFRPSVRTSPGAVKSTWMRSSLRSLSLSNGAWTQTSPLDQSAGLVEKTAWARPLTNVGTAGCGAGAGAGAATRAASAPGSPGGSADAGLAATTVARVIAVTAPARNRVLNPAPPPKAPPSERTANFTTHAPEPRKPSRIRQDRAIGGLELAQRSRQGAKWSAAPDPAMLAALRRRIYGSDRQKRASRLGGRPPTRGDSLGSGPRECRVLGS